MVRISTFVFFDIETTGLPWKERNQTKITDLCFIATAREDIRKAALGEIPPVSKLCFPLQPEKEIQQEAVKLTGITNESLKYALKFRQKVNTILTFLEELPKPVCLVAHNGNNFDFKILLAEFKDANAMLPQDILCVDSLVGFRKLLQNSKIELTPKRKRMPSSHYEENELLTDDEESSVDELSSNDDDSSHNLSEEDDLFSMYVTPQFKKKEKTVVNSKGGHSLSELYKRLLNKEEVAHRAEADCVMLLQCVIAIKSDFIRWADSACKLLTDIKPLHRY